MNFLCLPREKIHSFWSRHLSIREAKKFDTELPPLKEKLFLHKIDHFILMCTSLLVIYIHMYMYARKSCTATTLALSDESLCQTHEASTRSGMSLQQEQILWSDCTDVQNDLSLIGALGQKAESCLKWLKYVMEFNSVPAVIKEVNILFTKYSLQMLIKCTQILYLKTAQIIFNDTLKGWEMFLTLFLEREELPWKI